MTVQIGTPKDTSYNSTPKAEEVPTSSAVKVEEKGEDKTTKKRK